MPPTTADIEISPAGSPKHVTPPSLSLLPADQYGQTHPVESEAVISQALQLIESELAKLGELNADEHLLNGIRQAEERCPGLFGSRDHRLMFLRCEMFNVDLAARRMAKYWNRRIALFGEQAFSPMLNLDGPLCNDSSALAVGFMRLLPSKDDTGRAIMNVEANRLDSKKYAKDSMVRAVWYMMHAALESETAQMRGIIALVHMRGLSYRQFDKELITKIADSLKGCLPIRLSAIHICHPPMIFSMIFPLIKLLLGARLRKRIKLYSAAGDEVLTELSQYKLTADLLPTELGGDLVLDNDAWLSERKKSGK